MKTAAFALTLAMLVGAPLIASAATGMNSSLKAVSYPTMQRQGAPKQTVWTLSQARPHNGPKTQISRPACNA